MSQPVFTMKTAAKKLGTGPVILFRTLREAGILHAKQGIKNLPLRQYIERGYFKTQATQYNKGDVKCQQIKTLVTPLGLSFIEEIISGMGGTQKMVRPQQHRPPG